MFIVTFAVGYLPICASQCAQSKSFLRFLTLFGAGLLVGVVMLIIIPEGVIVILSGHVHAPMHKAHGARINAHQLKESY